VVRRIDTIEVQQIDDDVRKYDDDDDVCELRRRNDRRLTITLSSAGRGIKFERQI
jgi:hypothetical protein